MNQNYLNFFMALLIWVIWPLRVFNGSMSTNLLNLSEVFTFGGERIPARASDFGKTKVLLEKPKQETNVSLIDPALSAKWDLKTVDAEKAWAVTQGDRRIVVAIIDTGCDVNHEDLRQNMWSNPGETGFDKHGRNRANNGIDDDENGYIDDVHGWDFTTHANDVSDSHGHGTHIAGIVGAVGGNGVGIIGVSPKVSLMILKAMDPGKSINPLVATISAIEYAVKMKAHIINYSAGGPFFSAQERAAIQKAGNRGVLFVAAAGNFGTNSDRQNYFPADYGLSNIISVTAVDSKTEVLPSSNYGINTVHIAAPGHNILSTLPNNSYGFLTGTSQATAFATGAAALVMAHRPTFNGEETKKYLLLTGDIEKSLIEKTGFSRKLNLFKALTMLDAGIGVTGVKAANIDKSAPLFSTDSTLFSEPTHNRRPSAHKNQTPGSPIHQFSQSLLEKVMEGK
jgi:thermitase